MPSCLFSLHAYFRTGITLRCFSRSACPDALFCQKFHSACPLPDQNPTLLAVFLARIPKYISALVTFFFKKSLPYFCFYVGSYSPPFCFYFFFLVSCSPLSILSNNILQIFVYHYLKIMNDTFIHCINLTLLS